jgi:molybdopterin molybdotransferase
MIKQDHMLESKNALKLILSVAHELPAEKVNLKDALLRVLASGIHYDTDMPPFNKSAMDGYACRKQDILNRLEAIETIPAGKLPVKRVGENQCSKIMTGAMVPEGADFVFKKEDAETGDEEMILCTTPDGANHIVFQGTDIRKGEEVLSKSTLIMARHMPVIAGAGITRPEVFSRPAVAVLATGTELVPASMKPRSFQIRNTNSGQLLAQLAEMKIKPENGGIVKDDENVLFDRMQEMMVVNQVILVTGGVSVGDYDLVPEVIEKLGFKTLVTSTSIKPGKPMIFAVKENKYCFGLSGNPVSSYIQFELYVKPFLYRMMGHHYQQHVLRFTLGMDIQHEISDRLNFIPAYLNSGSEVMPVEFHGSAHIHALSGATHLVEIPAGIKNLRRGETVNVRPL